MPSHKDQINVIHVVVKCETTIYNMTTTCFCSKQIANKSGDVVNA